MTCLGYQSVCVCVRISLNPVFSRLKSVPIHFMQFLVNLRAPSLSMGRLGRWFSHQSHFRLGRSDPRSEGSQLELRIEFPNHLVVMVSDVVMDGLTWYDNMIWWCVNSGYGLVVHDSLYFETLWSSSFGCFSAPPLNSLKSWRLTPVLKTSCPKLC